MPLPCTYSLAPAILEAAQPDETMPTVPSSLFLAVFCLFSAVFFTSFLVRMMIRVAVLDHPGHRSAHEAPTPKGGGVGVMATFFVLFPILQGVTGQPILSAPVLLTALATALLAGVSWLDDLYQWPPSIKFAAQCLAAVLVVAGGTSLPLPLAWGGAVAGAVISVLWLVFITNAINFMDGLNGLISGSLAVGCGILALIGPAFGVSDLFWPALLLCACLCGFLPFNYPKARIFLGDVGSQSCGLLAGAAALHVAHATSQPSGWVLGPCLLFPLIYDVLFTLVRRKLAGHSLVQAHRGHLYQVLHRSGINAAMITLAEWGFVVWGAGVAWWVAPMAFVPGFISALGLLLAPQLLWIGLAVLQTRRHPVGPW
ncbi:glycosyltransferase family 4 protein [Acetobacter cerevisiae]|uniref:glycosyltransferase family 4 protein n=1 Tax=Acetobacter cerevisiae TaxID=178900 RepID=UPI0020A1FA4E|nr:UDP-phosphate alpha-N-acetylglucosaminephosphotransferase [Acetobacter cerevisiae]MCP1277300.1 UDP-phosphate alpha-N-acetylglucosaminephosphotransferase [Acetobacter cerevisiae]